LGLDGADLVRVETNLDIEAVAFEANVLVVRTTGEVLIHDVQHDVRRAELALATDGVALSPTGDLLIATIGDELSAYDTATGEQRWTRARLSVLGFVDSGDLLVVEDDWLSLANADTGDVWAHMSNPWTGGLSL